MSGRRITAVRVLTTASLVVAAACGSPSNGDGVRVRVVVTPRLGLAPLYIAHAEGYFAKRGLDVELEEMTRSVDAMAALGQGRVDVSSGAVNAGLLNAMARGVPIRIVAGMGFADPTGCTAYAVIGARPWTPDFLERRNAPLRVSADPTQFTGFMMDRHLARAGSSLADAIVDDVPEPTEGEALASGQIDAVSAGEPWVSRMVASGRGHVWARMEEVLPDAQISSMWFGPTLLRDNRDAGRRFMAAYLDAVRQYSAGPTPRNLEIVSSFTGLDAGQLASACWTPVRKDGRVNVASIREFRDWLGQHGYLEQAEQPVTDADLVDQTFVEWASAQAGR
jgi:NitT/TauT family transport system substrate-binding protein